MLMGYALEKHLIATYATDEERAELSRLRGEAGTNEGARKMRAYEKDLLRKCRQADHEEENRKFRARSAEERRAEARGYFEGSHSPETAGRSTDDWRDRQNRGWDNED